MLAYNKQSNPLVTDEWQRIQALQELAILDTEPEERFDRLTQLAARVFNVPYSLVSLVDEHRLWFKSRYQIEALELCRERTSFCSEALKEEQLLVVEDTQAHELFSASPLVTGFPHVRFYAGAILRTASGYPLGTLCIMDTSPRSLTESERVILLDMAQMVESELRLTDRISQERAQAGLRANRDSLLYCLNYQGMIHTLTYALQRPREPDTSSVAYLLSLEVHDWNLLNLRYNDSIEESLILQVHERLQSVFAADRASIGRVEPERLAVLFTVEDQSALATVLDELERVLSRPFVVGQQEIEFVQRVIHFPLRTGLDESRKLLQMLHYLDTRQSYPLTGLQILDASVWLDRVHHLRSIRSRLPNAIRNNELSLHFQPKLEISPHRLAGMEALLRWDDPALGRVSPLEILEVAGRTGLCRELDMWVIRNVIRQLAQWQQAGIDLVPVAINIMPELLSHPPFTDFLCRELQLAGLDGRWIELEILEHAIVNDFEAVFANIQVLAEFGVRFAIDDFGTGYSALSYLPHLPVDVLKIDRSFVHSMLDNEKAAALIGAIVSVGRHAGLSIVAEGVETYGQYVALKELGCHAVQGYLFAHPAPAETAVQWLRGRLLPTPASLARAARSE
ncbi:EAL domain-containing protein [Kushneria phosphatilytica]|uniref:GGDEF domain-containing protein n=1 Tax=Kushneria phosphatilytica TaxID=657387 RepID=A0A5C0ZV75_9GAMM|nr:EAL domain-containing protein [Kushneria phosphatilytica]QEL10470.1 GGDEF domain-containing protein [Kushneria phosphatilytica]